MNQIIKKPLNINAIKEYLSDDNAKISLFDSIDSTNSWLIKNGGCGDVCLSEMQTAGKGRRGNQWVSPDAGNIYFSMCWCFDKLPKYWSLLGLVVGVAIAESLYEIGLRQHGLKWPNDIFWQGKKLGGILLESKNLSGRVVVGIGLNVAMQETNHPDISKNITQPWVSLQDALIDKQVSRNMIIASIMKHLQKYFLTFGDLSVESFIAQWQKWDVLLGEVVSIEDKGKQTIGKMVGIDHQGRVGILLENQTIHYFSSADIKLKISEDISSSKK